MKRKINTGAQKEEEIRMKERHTEQQICWLDLKRQCVKA